MEKTQRQNRKYISSIIMAQGIHGINIGMKQKEQGIDIMSKVSKEASLRE